MHEISDWNFDKSFSLISMYYINSYIVFDLLRFIKRVDFDVLMKLSLDKCYQIRTIQDRLFGYFFQHPMLPYLKEKKT